MPLFFTIRDYKMATTITSHDSTGYVLVTDSVDALIQNISSYEMRVAFALSTPSVNTLSYHILSPNEVLQKLEGTPADDVYARTSLPNVTGNLSVS